MKYISDSYGERCRFDAFCKTVIRNEAKTYLRDLCRQRKRETQFSALSQYEMDKLCTMDEYPSDSVVFTALAATYISRASWWLTPLPACRNGSKAF